MGKSTKSIIVVGMGVAIAAAAYFGAYGQWQKLGDARAAFDASKAVNERIKKSQSDASAFLAKYQNSTAEAAMADKALPVGDPDIPSLLDSFSKLVADSGLNLTSLNILDDSNTDATSAPQPHAIQSLDIDIQAVGSYEAFNDFLLRTQRHLRLIDLVNLGLMPNQEGDTNSSNLTYTLRFRAYYQQ